MYNLYNFEAEFLQSLKADKKLSEVSKKNYIADFNYFWQWFTLWTKQFDLFPATTQDNTAGFFMLLPKSIGVYQEFLQTNGVAPATILRHTATARRLIEYCKKIGKIPLETAITTLPIAQPKPKNSIKYYQSISKKIISEFCSFLVAENAAVATQRNYTNDIEQFLNWVLLENGADQKISKSEEGF